MIKKIEAIGYIIKAQWITLKVWYLILFKHDHEAAQKTLKDSWDWCDRFVKHYYSIN